MPELTPYDDSGPLAMDQLESLVRSACGYVQPTPDLRPKTIETARSAYQQKRTNRRLGSLTLFVILLTIAGFPDFLFSNNSKFTPIASVELHRRAAQRVVAGKTEANWALYEVFSDLRREQAARLLPVD